MSKKKSDKIAIEIVFADKTLRGNGENMLEAIESIPVPIKVFLKGTIKITQGDKSLERTWMPKRIRRLFRPLSQSTVAKELTYLLK